MPYRTIVVLIALFATCAALAQDQPEQEPEGQREIPWPVRLGARALQVEHVFPLIDRVVLVPDAATYVDELSKWSPLGRWPVLIEDDHLATMFIRRFKPAEVIRRESVGDRAIDQATLEQIIVTTWGGRPGATVRQVFDAHNFTPVGAVVASVNDPAWPAAVALAAGRGQPMIWLDDNFRQPNAVLSRAQATELSNLIDQGLELLGWPYQSLGEAIDTITLCRSVAGKVDLPRPDNQEVEPAAITDFLGRHAPDNTGDRYAIVGWIFGDEIRTAYMAMCSLFLPRVNVTMFDGYGHREGEGWDFYDMTGPTAMLSEHGCEVIHLHGRRHTTETAWLGMIANGVETDIFVMNSRGNPYEFELYESRAWPPDVPILNTPVALHLTHSWSMRFPENTNTVGGAWIDRGVYAYVGSTQEPYLSAFLTPDMLVRRWLSNVPFLVGARYWENNPVPFSGPWKVNTVGDPLMVFPPPLHFRKEREKQAAEYGLNLRRHVEQLMQDIREDPSGERIAEAIELLDLIGRDEIALGLWRLALSQNESEATIAAHAALGPLFRARNATGFLQAYRLTNRPDERATDMLWHLVGPRLSMLNNDDLLLMQSAVRRGTPHVDIRRLAPHLASTFGDSYVRELVQQEIDAAEPGRNRNQLQRILRQH